MRSRESVTSHSQMLFYMEEQMRQRDEQIRELCTERDYERGVWRESQQRLKQEAETYAGMESRACTEREQRNHLLVSELRER